MAAKVLWAVLSAFAVLIDAEQEFVIGRTKCPASSPTHSFLIDKPSKIRVHVNRPLRDSKVSFEICDTEDDSRRCFITVRGKTLDGKSLETISSGLNQEDWMTQAKISLDRYVLLLLDPKLSFDVEWSGGKLKVRQRGESMTEWTSVDCQLESDVYLTVVGAEKATQFSFEALTFTEMVSELDAALRTRNAKEPCDDDCLARLNGIVDAAAFWKGHPRYLDPDEKMVVDWMRVAVASVSTAATTDEGVMPLATDVASFLGSRIERVELTNRAGQTLRDRNIASSGEHFLKQVTAKLNETLSYVKHLKETDVGEIFTSAKERAVRLSEKTDVQLKDKRTELNSQETSSKFGRWFSVGFTILAAVATVALSVIAAPVGIAMAAAGAAYLASESGGAILSTFTEDWDDKIKDINKEISKLEETQKDLSFLLPMLKKSKELFVKFKEASEKNETRFWLTSIEMQKFRAELIVLPIENFKAAMAQDNMLKLFENMATSLADALDQVHTYIFQETTVHLLTYPLYDQNSSPLDSSVTSLQQVIGENTLANDFRAVLVSLRLFAFPYCRKLKLDIAEGCLSKPLGSAMVQCVINELRRLKSDVTGIKSTTRDGDRQYQPFDVDGTAVKYFYKWWYEKHNATIKALLSGEEVVLTADVIKRPENITAIKFEDVYLDFRHTDPTKRAEVDRVLDCVKVNMVHSGVSHFKCNQGAVSFKHRPITFTYPVLQREKICSSRNADCAFSMFQAPNDLMLSPYTSWTVKLIMEFKVWHKGELKGQPRGKCRPSLFQQLANEPVNVLLRGRGTYVQDRVDCGVCGGAVEERVGKSNAS